MPLSPYIPPTRRIRDTRASVAVLEANSSSQTDETGVQVSGSREIHQEGEHDLAQHWGFSSRPPQGTELVEILDQYGSRVAVAERIPCPVALADGETALWTSATSYVKISSAGKVTVQAKSGQDVAITTGQKILMNKSGGTVGVARMDDSVAAYASTPVQPSDMAGWIALVTLACQTINPAIVAPVNFGKISSASSIVEVE